MTAQDLDVAEPAARGTSQDPSPEPPATPGITRLDHRPDPSASPTPPALGAPPVPSVPTSSRRRQPLHSPRAGFPSGAIRALSTALSILTALGTAVLVAVVLDRLERIGVVHIDLVVLTVGAWLLAAMLLGLGSLRRPHRPLRPPLLAGGAVLLGLALGSAAGIDIETFGELALLVVLVTGAVSTVRLLLSVLDRPRTVLVGPASDLPRREAAAAVAVIGVTDPAGATSEALTDVVRAVVTEERADVVRIMPGFAPGTASNLSWALRDLRVAVQTDLLEGTLAPHRVARTDGLAASVVIAPPVASPLGFLIKRSMDILGSAVLLILVSPLLLLAALAIRLQDSGPVLFLQERIGQDGRPFRIIKLRTMAVDADARLAELLEQQDTGTDPLFKIHQDPRITPLGAVLRRTSIDELPQLLNVLGGSMSLVGPRPQRAEEVALYRGNASHRLGVAPGITGLWQVSGRSDLTWEEARRLDVHYAHNWTPAMDVRILVQTIRAVLAEDGAV